jgi:hypothetical protein
MSTLTESCEKIAQAVNEAKAAGCSVHTYLDAIVVTDVAGREGCVYPGYELTDSTRVVA